MLTAIPLHLLDCSVIVVVANKLYSTRNRMARKGFNLIYSLQFLRHVWLPFGEYGTGYPCHLTHAQPR